MPTSFTRQTPGRTALRRLLAGAIGIAVAFTLVGCLPGVTRAPTDTSSPAAAAPAQAPAESPLAPVPAIPTAGEENTAQAPSRGEALNGDAAAVALERAEGFTAEFIRHDRDAAAWFAGISPFLSADAADAYSGSNASRVTATTLTGEPVLEIGTESFARVSVPTDAGAYTVLLTLSPQTQQWQVTRIMTAP